MAGRRQFGNVRKLPSGRWQARYPSGDGELVPADETFATKREAGRYLDRVRTDIDRRACIDPRRGQITFGGWTEQYLALSTHKRATTAACDRVVARTHLVPALGTRPLASIAPLDVQRVVSAMAERLAPATVRTNEGVLRAVLGAAVAADLLVRSPCGGIKLPAPERATPHPLPRPRRAPAPRRRNADRAPPGDLPRQACSACAGRRWRC